MLANLIHSFCRVQQLLVRVIFLPGISDGSKPIRHSHLVEQISSRMRSRHYRPAESSRQRQSHLLHRQALGR